MEISRQPQIIGSGRKKAGRRLGSVPSNKFPLLLPEMVGHTFGKLKIVSPEVYRKTHHGPAYLLAQCVGCEIVSLKLYSNLIRGVAGCRSCGNPRQAPKWLVMRAIAAKQRCTNPKDGAYERYGARGIRFEFSSPTAMAVWIQEKLGLKRELELDRINNDGHYAPGNLRYATSKEQKANQRPKKRTSMTF